MRRPQLTALLVAGVVALVIVAVTLAIQGALVLAFAVVCALVGAAVIYLRFIHLATGHAYRRLEALSLLRGFVRPRLPLPAYTLWAASPELLLTVVGAIVERRAQLVVELGSGASSLWIGYALEALGEGGRLLALEHDPRYAAATREEVRRHGLESVVTVVDAPLCSVTVDAERYRFYDVAALAAIGERSIDVLLIDGPPGRTQPQARYPAVPLLLGRLAPAAIVILDDALRRDERRIARRWLRQYPQLTGRFSQTEKGTLVLRHDADLANLSAPERISGARDDGTALAIGVEAEGVH